MFARTASCTRESEWCQSSTPGNVSTDGRIRSTIERRFCDCSSDEHPSSSNVAKIAPHFEWPITTTSRVPNCSAANSTLPICDGATMFPATRITNRSPRPWSKIIYAGTLESEHPRMIANGSWTTANSRRRAWFVNVLKQETPDTNRWFPSCRILSASWANIIEVLSILTTPTTKANIILYEELEHNLSIIYLAAGIEL